MGKMKFILAIFLFSVSGFSQSENWNGNLDTAKIKNFYNDTTIYSGWFKLWSFSAVRHTLYLDDTSSAGYASDSCSGEWGIQTGHPSFLTTNYAKKKMELGRKMVLDTFNTTVGGRFTVDSAGMTTFDVNNIPQFIKGRIDTLFDSLGTTVRSAYAYQSRGPFSEWDVYYRYWIHGIAGNLKSKHTKGYFQGARQVGHKVTNQ